MLGELRLDKAMIEKMGIDLGDFNPGDSISFEVTAQVTSKDDKNPTLALSVSDADFGGAGKEEEQPDAPIPGEGEGGDEMGWNSAPQMVDAAMMKRGYQ
jgi:hypothetical protein